MRGTKKVFLVRAIDGRIISSIITEECQRGENLICCSEPQIYLAMNETWSNDKIRWAKFDGTKSDPKKVLGGFTLPQLIGPVYQILTTRYFWRDELKNKFLTIWSAVTGLMKDRAGECYFEDVTNVIEDPEKKCRISKGAACVEYNEPFAPITEAVWEEFIL